MNSESVVQIARSYIGETEIPNNAGFHDPTFQAKMQEVGWERGAAWCSYFAELCYHEAAIKNNDLASAALITKLFSGSATTTFKNFDLDKTFKTGKIARVGALAIWRFGSGWQGHADIVCSVQDTVSFEGVDGNTNDVGGREGYIVAPKHRVYVKPYTATGLNIVGFVYLC